MVWCGYGLALAIMLAAAPAAAEVKSQTEAGFALESVATINAGPREVYAALGHPERWWNSAHTYSGDAKNLRLDMKAGGCFCERIPKVKSQIAHGQVVYLQPERALRLSAALGPLQAEGVGAALTWTIKPLADGATELRQTYVVGGYMRAGAANLAPVVDRVMVEQLARLKAHLDGR
jgi:uncharacterized protein YndB with AHSA1/START domain